MAGQIHFRSLQLIPESYYVLCKNYFLFLQEITAGEIHCTDVLERIWYKFGTRANVRMLTLTYQFACL